MYSYVNSSPCLGCEPIDAGVEYPDVQEEEFEEQAPTKGEEESITTWTSMSNLVLIRRVIRVVCIKRVVEE